MPGLPFYASLRHLIIRIDRMGQVLQQLPQLRALRTLSLESLSVYKPLHMALHVTALPDLKHLSIVNFSVDSIAAPQGCQLHATWDNPEGELYALRDMLDFGAWLSSSMWASANIPLSSLRMRDGCHVTDAVLKALEGFLSRSGPLEYLCLDIDRLVDDSKPLEVSEHRWQGILRARNLRIVMRTVYGCALLSLGESSPAWEHLSLEAAGEIDLCSQSKSSIFAGLQEFNVCGKPRAPLAMGIHSELQRTRRTCHERACRESPEGDEPWQTEGVYHLTSVSEGDMQSFDETMACGCQSCLLCLRRKGDLPAAFKEIPAMQSSFGTLGYSGTSGSEPDDIAYGNDSDDTTSGSDSQSDSDDD